MKLLYRKINGRIDCSKINFEPINSFTGKPHDLNIVFEKELTSEEESLSIEELKMKYPYQENGEKEC